MKIKIVMVDDEKQIVEGYKLSILKKYEDVDVISFDNSIQTYNYIKDNGCDILICDINMPVKNGIELVQEIKQILPNIQVIFLTGFSSFDYIYQTNKIDNASYLIKIEPDEELFKLIDKKIEIIENNKQNKELMLENEKKNQKLENEVNHLKYLELLKGNSTVLGKYDIISKLILFDVKNDNEYIIHLINEQFIGIDVEILNIANEGLVCVLCKEAYDNNVLNIISKKIVAKRNEVIKIVYTANTYTADKIYEVFTQMKEIINKQSKALINIFEFESYLDLKEDELTRIDNYIIKNLENNVSLSMVADYFHYNSSYFSRYFKILSGETFKNHLFALQIQQAKYYLDNTNLFISDIAKKVGFESVDNFTAIFKRLEGITPTEYKKAK